MIPTNQTIFEQIYRYNRTCGQLVLPALHILSVPINNTETACVVSLVAQMIEYLLDGDATCDNENFATSDVSCRRGPLRPTRISAEMSRACLAAAAYTYQMHSNDTLSVITSAFWCGKVKNSGSPFTLHRKQKARTVHSPPLKDLK